MFTRALSIAIVIAMLQSSTFVETAAARSKAEKRALFAEKVKAGVERLGVGEDTRVAVRLHDKMKLTGYVSDAGEDSFVVTDLKTGKATTVAYADVAQIKGNNLNSSDRLLLGVLIGAAIVLIVVVVATR